MSEQILTGRLERISTTLLEKHNKLKFGEDTMLRAQMQRLFQERSHILTRLQQLSDMRRERHAV